MTKKGFTNFTIKIDVAEELEKFCEESCRSPSKAVEWLLKEEKKRSKSKNEYAE